MTTGTAARKPRADTPSPTAERAERITVAKARDAISDLVLRACYSNERFIIVRRDKPSAVLIGVKEYERLAALDGGKK